MNRLESLIWANSSIEPVRSRTFDTSLWRIRDPQLAQNVYWFVPYTRRSKDDRRKFQNRKSNGARGVITSFGLVDRPTDRPTTRRSDYGRGASATVLDRTRVEMFTTVVRSRFRRRQTPCVVPADEGSRRLSTCAACVRACGTSDGPSRRSRLLCSRVDGGGGAGVARGV